MRYEREWSIRRDRCLHSPRLMAETLRYGVVSLSVVSSSGAVRLVLSVAAVGLM